MQFICPKCGKTLEAGFKCQACGLDFMSGNLPSFVDINEYWGEFKESDLKEITGLMREGRYAEAKKIIKDLGRWDFIFGLARTDFLYYLNIGKDSVVLDTGCGLGVHSFNMARYAKEVVGFDLSRLRVEFCNERKKMEKVDNVQFLHSDFFSLPFGKDTFDVVTMNGVLEWVGTANRHADPREDQIEVLKRVRELLKPGGRIYVGIENRYASTYWRGKGVDHSWLKFTSLMPRQLADWYVQLRKGHSYRTYTYGAGGYVKLFREAGFDVSFKNLLIAHPGYNYPQYIVPYCDYAGMKFIIKNMTKNMGVKGKLASQLIEYDIFYKLARKLFYSYLIVAEK